MPKQRLLVLVVFLAAFTLAADRPKRVWEWSVDERLAERLDPAHILERQVAYERAHAKALQRSPDPEPQPANFAHVIDGRRNPELFLPHELFDALMTGLTGDGTLRGKQRAYYGRAIRAFGYDDAEFWAQLESVSALYLAVRSSGRADAVCGARHDALQAARELFGRERFDEFLYVVIAPSSQKSEAATDAGHLAEELRRAVRGCR